MLRIAHISDIHIKNFERHKEYLETLRLLVEDLKQRRPNRIVITGDTAHTKTQISPEFVKICSQYFIELSDIAPVDLILGNHDGLLTNLQREDAITPIVDLLKASGRQINLYKNSGIYQIWEGSFEASYSHTYIVFSPFDEDLGKWSEIKIPDSIGTYICLFHGPIQGSKTDAEWIMSDSRYNVSLFKDCDYVMMGDIHKQQFLDDEKKIAYAGSLIQQNFGEEIKKGYLLWDIESKEKHKVQFIEIKNVKPYYTLELEEDLKIPEVDFQKNAIIRVVSRPMNVVEQDRVKKQILEKYSPEEIKFIDDLNVLSRNVSIIEKAKIENLRDITVQEKLIKTYLGKKGLEEKEFEKIFDINKKFNVLLEKEDESHRNTQYQVLSLKFSNMFSYGENNVFDYTKLKGITGIFGPNGVGKSSVAVDVLSYLLFGKISKSKNFVKNQFIVNENKESCFAEGTFKINNDILQIKRTTKIVQHGMRKGDVHESGKTDVEFRVFKDGKDEQLLTDEQRRETDKIIRIYFGTYEDFVITSVAPQFQLMKFINSGGTDRKKILGKYFDLDFFEKKYRLAKEEFRDIEVRLKDLQQIDFATEITTNESKIDVINGKLNANIHKINELKKDKEKVKKEISDLKIELQSIENFNVTLEEIEKDISTYQSSIKEKEQKIVAAKNQYETAMKSLVETKNKLLNFDVDSVKYQIEEKKIDVENLKKQKQFVENREVLIKRVKKELFELEKISCITYEGCCYKKKFEDLSSEKDDYINMLKNERELLKHLINEQSQKALEQLEMQLHQHHVDTNRYEKEKASNDVLGAKIKLEEERVSSIKRMIEEKKNQQKLLEKQEEKIKRNKEIDDKLDVLSADEKDLGLQINKLSSEIIILNQELGKYKSNLSSINEKLKKFDELKIEYNAYEHYIKSMSKDGISYNIVSENLHFINQEINKILSSGVDFQVTLESEQDEKELEIFFSEDGKKKRHIELCSGMQKIFSALAIRAAFIKVSSLPKPNFLILDEIFDNLDPKHLKSVTDVLTYMKDMFENIIIITHNESLRDICDNYVEVSMEEGFAKIHQ